MYWRKNSLATCTMTSSRNIDFQGSEHAFWLNFAILCSYLAFSPIFTDRSHLKLVKQNERAQTLEKSIFHDDVIVARLFLRQYTPNG